MDDDAKDLLWKSLKIEETYDRPGLPGLNEPEDRDSFLLDEMIEQGRDVYPTFSYFVVERRAGDRTEYFYISPDWPSAENFAKNLLAKAN
jgi:hypothetical protein